MGGEVSKVNAKGNRIPPKFLHRLYYMRKRRRFSRPTKQSTPSKKELLLYVIEENEKLEGCLKKGEHYVKDMKKVEGHDQERVAKIIEAIVKEEEEDHGDIENEEDDDDDDNKDDQRMIKRTHAEENGDFGPGSPSFRVYFTNNKVEDKKINEVIIGNKEVIKNTTPIAATNTPTTPIAATIPSTKVVVPMGKKGKKETKRKSFRGPLPKNLLNVRSCCSAARSSPDRTRLLPGKAPA